MTLTSRVAITIGISIAALCLSSAQAQEADLVLRNAVIWTVDDEQPRAEAVASLRDRIIYVGSDAGVAPHIGAGTTVIDLDGAFVTPGYNDNHVHFASTGRCCMASISSTCPTKRRSSRDARRARTLCAGNLDHRWGLVRV